MIFGSRVMDATTGVILNDEQGQFDGGDPGEAHARKMTFRSLGSPTLWV